MRDYVLIYINGLRHEIRGGGLFQSLSDYLRYATAQIGTKVVCAEGDCGACTVVLGELGQDDKIIYTAIDSCLVFLPMLHGKQLITVENLSVKVKKEEVKRRIQEAEAPAEGSKAEVKAPE